MRRESEPKSELAPTRTRVRLPSYPLRPTSTFLAFIAFVVARYVQVGARNDILAAIRFELLLGVGVIVIAGVGMAGRMPGLGRGQNMVVMISLLFLAMLIQLPMAAAPEVANTMFMDKVIKFALMTFFMVVMVESPKYLRWFLAAFLFSVFYITLEAVQGLISGGLVWENQGIPRLHGAVPIYQHPNSLGGVAMGALPFTVFLFPWTKKKLVRLFFLALSATALVCVVYSGSRTAYVGILSFVLWWFFQSGKKLRWIGWAVIGALVVLVIMPPEYIERFKSIGGQEKEGHSKDTRMVILSDAWTIFLENPQGVGVASFPAVRMARFGRVQDTHNLYLEVATNLGIQGLIIFLGLVGVMMWDLRRTAFGFRDQTRMLIKAVKKSSLPPGLRRPIGRHVGDLNFLEATAKATAGFILIRLVLGLFGMDLYEVYWWFGAGIVLVLSALTVTTRKITGALIAQLNESNEP
jgi:putative inorganic carbon (HCO3(-)) transporter